MDLHAKVSCDESSWIAARRVDAWHRCQPRVSQGSTIRVATNTYSVPLPAGALGGTLAMLVAAGCGLRGKRAAVV